MKRPAIALLSSVAFSLAALDGGVAGAAEPPIAAEPPAPEPRSTIVDMGPNRLLLATGSASFAFAYGGSAWVGATSSRAFDRPLLIPFAGPWVALAARGACGESGIPCGQQTTYAALLAADGLVQAASVVQIALAFLHRELGVTNEPVLRSARVTLAPARTAGGGVGLAAIGEF